MAWACNKFLKKLFKPNAISNNELADFISRVPDNEELVRILFITHIYIYIYNFYICRNFEFLCHDFFYFLQKDIQELPSPDDVAKAKLQVKKKPAADAEII